ncbi:MAG: hypothetical protein H0X15_12015 [Acidobacteria bacterium]|nr:hypothetical protein [Acidobacteriota bacterium]
MICGSRFVFISKVFAALFPLPTLMFILALLAQMQLVSVGQRESSTTEINLFLICLLSSFLLIDGKFQ